MPQVPYIPFETVLPEGQIAPQRIEATPSDFGGQVAQGLNQDSNQLMQQAQVKQQLANETNVNDVINNKFFPAFQAQYQKYYSLQGKDAVDQLPAYQQSMRDLVQQYRQDLPNGMQQRAFDQETGRRLQYEFGDMGRYADQQGKVYQAQTMKDRVNLDIDSAADKYNDPNLFKATLVATAQRWAKYGAQTGMSPEEISVLQHQSWNNLFATVMSRRIAAGDVGGAVRLLQEGVKGGFVSGAAETKMIETLGPKINEATLTGAVNGLISQYGLAQANGNFAQAYQDVMDPTKAATLGLTTVEQRNFVANTITGMQKNAAKQAQNKAASTDDTFLRGVYSGQINPQYIANYKDPQTGAAPSATALGKALHWVSSDERSQNRTDINVYANVRNKILDGEITDPRQITPYYGHGLSISAGNDLSTLAKTMGDTTKSPYFTMAVKAYDKAHKDDFMSDSYQSDAAASEETRNAFIIGLAQATDNDGKPLTGPAILERGGQMMKQMAQTTSQGGQTGTLPTSPRSGEENPKVEQSESAPQPVGTQKGTLNPVYKLPDGSHVVDTTKRPILVGTDRHSGQPVYRLPDGRLVTAGGPQ